MTGKMLEENLNSAHLGENEGERLFLRHFLTMKLPMVGFKQNFKKFSYQYRDEIGKLSDRALRQLSNILGHKSLKRKLVKIEMKKRGAK